MISVDGRFALLPLFGGLVAQLESQALVQRVDFDLERGFGGDGRAHFVGYVGEVVRDR